MSLLAFFHGATATSSGHYGSKGSLCIHNITPYLEVVARIYKGISSFVDTIYSRRKFRSGTITDFHSSTAG